eukprot:CAMPEP_0177381348 /NCGR_PEP_ID=MMETSP0368-20130122/48017_1 /TAXON_ID=447022 ORGANISM="Scrippsiella hangoei-like, Strain SHHI-4" /NCGR_SAMPLE_ID=MMETSP0368 /ASSEMBLY_ACC=CAM_ASM_000363 /LENGTH=47 /DNA_ID= /DNA_START= /DNA_END= /DNA_ORIENTATION=
MKDEPQRRVSKKYKEDEAQAQVAQGGVAPPKAPTDRKSQRSTSLVIA